jgi:hypothetical protein
MVARTGGDHQERQAVLGGNPGNQCLRAVATGDPEQVRTVGHALASQRGDVDLARSFEQRNLDAGGGCLCIEPESADLATPGSGIHDHEWPARWGGLLFGHAGRWPGTNDRCAPGDGRYHRQPNEEQDSPQQLPGNVEHDDEDRRGDGYRPSQPSDNAAVAHEPPPAGESQGDSYDSADQDAKALGTADDQYRYCRYRGEN